MRLYPSAALYVVFSVALVQLAVAGQWKCSPQTPKLCQGPVEAVFQGRYCDMRVAYQYNPPDGTWPLGECFVNSHWPSLYTKTVVEKGSLVVYKYAAPAGSPNGCSGTPKSIETELMNYCRQEIGVTTMLLPNVSEPVFFVMPAPPAQSAPILSGSGSAGSCPAVGQCNGLPYTTYFADASCTTPVSSSYLVDGLDRTSQPAQLNQCYTLMQEHYTDKNVMFTCTGNAFATSYYSSGCGTTAPYRTYSVPTGICIPNVLGGSGSSMHYCK